MKTAPFSQRLNDFIINRVKSINYVAGSFKEMDFEELKRLYLEKGKLYISRDNCQNTIFGSPEVNIMFRAWHDQVHIDANEGFEYMQETRVAFLQAAELPEDWHFEKMLILAEVVGQAAYHEKTGGFVPDQIQFTKDLLLTGKI